MYKIVKYEWELTEGEQAKAIWITEFGNSLSADIAEGIGAFDDLEIIAAEAFKATFYDEVMKRLDTMQIRYIFEDRCFGGFGVSKDCTKLLAARVEWIED